MQKNTWKMLDKKIIDLNHVDYPDYKFIVITKIYVCLGLREYNMNTYLPF